jgi:hypothetical protein
VAGKNVLVWGKNVVDAALRELILRAVDYPFDSNPASTGRGFLVM